MPQKLLAAFVLAASSLSAIGCAAGDLQRRVDGLLQEAEELQRQKAEVEADLLACRTRCEALERRAQVPRPAGAANTPFDVPGDLKGKVDIRKRGTDTVINLPSDVFFASGSASINAAGEKAMGQIADYIRKNHAGGLLRVEGHSDNDPIRRTKSKYHCNWELSFERAHAVMHYLVEKGKLDPHRVVCEAYGEFHPVDPGNKSKNRRVEIVVSQ